MKNLKQGEGLKQRSFTPINTGKASLLPLSREISPTISNRQYFPMISNNLRLTSPDVDDEQKLKSKIAELKKQKQLSIEYLMFAEKEQEAQLREMAKKEQELHTKIQSLEKETDEIIQLLLTKMAEGTVVIEGISRSASLKPNREEKDKTLKIDDSLADTNKVLKILLNRVIETTPASVRALL